MPTSTICTLDLNQWAFILQMLFKILFATTLIPAINFIASLLGTDMMYLRAGGLMIMSLIIQESIFTITTSKLVCFELLLDKPVKMCWLDPIFTTIWTTIVILKPFRNAFVAEQCVTRLATFWVFNYLHTDLALEVALLQLVNCIILAHLSQLLFS